MSQKDYPKESVDNLVDGIQTKTPTVLVEKMVKELEKFNDPKLMPGQCFVLLEKMTDEDILNDYITSNVRNFM